MKENPIAHITSILRAIYLNRFMMSLVMCDKYAIYM